MKKSWKIALSAGGVLFVGVGAFVFSGYNKNRMPTLPTPPGTVVPTGMRYVGGDEFDRAKPTENSTEGLTWKNGMLTLTPVWDSDSRRVRMTGVPWTSEDKANFDIPGRIEVRAAFHLPKGSHTSIGNAVALGWFSVENIPEPTENWNSFESRKYDGQFHTYGLAWDGDGFRFLRDGIVEPVPELHRKFLIFEIAKPMLPNSVRKLMSANLLNFTDRWRTTYEAAKHSPVTIMVGARNPEVEAPSADIDYVRIFQE